VTGGIPAAFIGVLVFSGGSSADSREQPVLHIGMTETFIEEDLPDGFDETDAESACQQLVQEVVGLRSDTVALENQEILAQRLASGRLQFGVFMGYEFAWAQARYPKLKVLTVNVSQHPSRHPSLIVHRDSPIHRFAELKGVKLAVPRWGQGYSRLFVAAQSRLAGQDPGAFLGQIETFEDAESPLDDVVDGIQRAAVVDRAALEAYQRRKPGRFARLKILSESRTMPPAVVAYYEGNLDPQLVARVGDALTNAHRQKRGELLLLQFRLTRFDPPSSECERMLAEMREPYPVPAVRKRIDARAEAAVDTGSLLPGKPPMVRPEGSPEQEARSGEPEYFLCVFAYDRVPPRARYSHTFATFIKAEGASIKAHTISWLPRGKDVEVARTQAEPGMNLQLPQTLRFARDLSARVYEWGPYRIRPVLYQRSLRQLEHLNSGSIRYKVLDGAWRPDTASNCIHAVSDIDGDNGYLTLDGAYGVQASACVVKHLSHWMIEPGQEHLWIQEKLGLFGQPITLVAYPRPASTAGE
jgi:ABC-type phosphate/phosphonate transport system substrate-binding protein